MNKPEFSFVFGYFVTFINIVALSSTGITVARQFIKVIRVSEKNQTLVNFHFAIMITAFCMSFSNGLALDRFYQAWVIQKSYSTSYLILNGFSDRIFMSLASVGLLIISLLKVPFFFGGNPDK